MSEKEQDQCMCSRFKVNSCPEVMGESALFYDGFKSVLVSS